LVEKVSMLLIVKVSNFTLAGYMSNSHAPKNAKIVCMKPATLVFFKVVNLVIKNLSIIYCGYPFLNNGEDSSVALRIMEIISLTISSISVENSTGYGIMGTNIWGNSSVSHSRFIFNNYYTLSSTNCSYGLG